MKPTVTSDVVTIDWVNHKMSVPWGIRRFNLMDYITVGDNITWDFIQNGNSADSAHIYVCTGDKLVMYATGENRQEVEFDLEVVAATDQTKALVLPLLVRSDRKVVSGIEFTRLLMIFLEWIQFMVWILACALTHSTNTLKKLRERHGN